MGSPTRPASGEDSALGTLGVCLQLRGGGGIPASPGVPEQSQVSHRLLCLWQTPALWFSACSFQGPTFRAINLQLEDYEFSRV